MEAVNATRVKILTSDDPAELEKLVNEFVKDKRNPKISLSTTLIGSKMQYIALIIYGMTSSRTVSEIASYANVNCIS